MLRVGSLFSGGGGLDLAVKQLWTDSELAWVAEFDQHASRVLETRFPGVPNLHDLSSVEWETVEPVDIMVGGYPCQPWSNAGKRGGFDDPRDGWPWFRDAISILQPGLVLLENVAGHLVGGAVRTVGDLAALGYDCRWSTVRASDVGAPHRRERWFCVAWNTECTRTDSCAASSGSRRPVGESGGRSAADASLVGRREGVEDGRGGTEGTRPWTEPGPRDAARPAADPDVSGLERPVDAPASVHPPGRFKFAARSVSPKRARTDSIEAPTDSDGLDEREPQRSVDGAKDRSDEPQLRDIGPASADPARTTWGNYTDAIKRWETIIGRPAPRPTDNRGRLNPALVEWMMGWPQGWVTDTDISRTNMLKILGNGVVPQQAQYAYRGLL